jgi:integrase
MARKVKDQNLDSRTARGRLKARGKPYYRAIDPGLHLGYRKLRNGPGKWVVRLYAGEQTYQVDTVATADDYSDSNGADILDYGQALNKARKLRDQRSRSDAGLATGPYTVSKALADYFTFLRTEGRPDHLVSDTERRAASMIEPKLGEIEVAVLTTKQLRTWRDNLVKAGARTRTAKGEPQKYREIDEDDDDALRARRATVNRIWTTLRAALNHAFTEGHVLTDREWRKVKPFKGVDGKRTAYLTIEEAKRLVNASEPDFRLLVQAALQTGGRYGSLTRLRVRDFHESAGTIDLRSPKGNGSEKTFSVILSPDEGVPFFKRLCAGRPTDALIFTKANGEPWGTNHQVKPMIGACVRAKIKPVGFNQLRHTWASHAVMNGTPLMIVAQNLGHTDTRMVENHYGHMAKSYVKDALHAGAPRFGFKADKKVVGLSAR